MALARKDDDMPNPVPPRKPLRKRLRPEVLYDFAFSTAGQSPVSGTVAGHLVPADRENLRDLRKRYKGELKATKHRILRERLASPTEECWIIVDGDGSPAGYCHLAYASTVNERIHRTVNVERGRQAYFFDDYVFKAHRGKGLHALSLARRCETAAQRGITEGITTITRKNTASLRSYGKLGLRRTAVLVHVPILGRTFRAPGR
jgi:GNAT superfamily N-acetyltransferase